MAEKTNLRKLSFGILDALRGGPIKKHLAEIISLINEKDENKIQAHIDLRLKKLLLHTKTSTQYYSKTNIEKGLSAFPVVNKNIIRENIDAFTSNQFDGNNRIMALTSGSTGTPFKVYYNKDKKNRNTADTIYFSGLTGFRLGMKLYYMKIWTKINRKSRKRSWIENIEAVDVTQLSDTNLPILIEKFKSEDTPFAILGYSSALEDVCKYLDKYHPDIKIANAVSVITMSEALNEYTKIAVKKYFGVSAVSRYSNIENGIIAQCLPNGDSSFLINRASYLVQVLSFDNDDPVAMGNPGRIVVTDFYNYAMPLIKYDTGDVGVLGKNHQGQLVLTRVEGRRMDMVYDTRGEVVSSFSINNNMLLFPEIKQYQFIQLRKAEYIFKLNPDGSFSREQELINFFKTFFGNDADIKVEYVKEIPLLNSGKRKMVVNLMHKPNH